MIAYQSIDPAQKDSPRILQTLISLRHRLDREIPPRNLKQTLILGTWNIREFDSSSFGERSDEAMLYIAEIVSRFDLIAIQEVRKDLEALDRLVDLLGRDRWHYIFTDITEGHAGNKERMAYLYDSRKVTFGGLAAELVLPPRKVKNDAGKTVQIPVQQISRTPFIAGFRSGDTSFILASVHMLYGSARANDAERVQEIEHFARFLNDRSKDPTTWSGNIIALGDFNIFRQDDLTIQALREEGFTVPEPFLTEGSNVNQDKIFDQIAFNTRPHRFETTGKAGVFNFFETIYRVEDQEHYIEQMGPRYHHDSRGRVRDEASQHRYYKTYWRTHQISDHYPLWVELRIDFTEEYLREKLENSQQLNTSTRSLTASPVIPIDERDRAVRMGESGAFHLEDFQAVEHRDRDLSRLQLAGMDLADKHFEGSNFRATNLAETNVSGSSFSGADFTDASLLHADLTGASFQEAHFVRTILSKATCFEADFSRAIFEEADLTGCLFADAIVEGARFINCRLSDQQEKDVREGGAEVG